MNLIGGVFGVGVALLILGAVGVIVAGAMLGSVRPGTPREQQEREHRLGALILAIAAFIIGCGLVGATA